MKIPQPCLAAFLLCLIGCGRQTVDSIPATRLIEESPNTYRLEIGMLSKSGFVPASVHRERYDRGLYSRADVQSAKGKPIVPLANWPVLEKLSGFKRSTETVTVTDVPHVFVQP